MSSEDPCSDELSTVVAAFTQRGTVEPGLDIEGEALLQKACRILDGIRALRDIDRHHTLVGDPFGNQSVRSVTPASSRPG